MTLFPQRGGPALRRLVWAPSHALREGASGHNTTRPHILPPKPTQPTTSHPHPFRRILYPLSARSSSSSTGPHRVTPGCIQSPDFALACYPQKKFHFVPDSPARSQLLTPKGHRPADVLPLRPLKATPLWSHISRLQSS